MRRTALLCLLLAAAFAAFGCAAGSPQPATTLEPATTSPDLPSPSDEPADEQAQEEAVDAPQPMNIECAIPEGFALSEDNSSGMTSLYINGAAYIQAGYEETDDETATPEGFRETMLQRLPEEAGEGFRLISCEEATLLSYPGYVIKWTSGTGADALEHEAHFILTDGFFYRVEYAAPSASAGGEAAKMKAFFDSVQLKDAAP